jgi:Fe-S-cluster containining protein
MNIDIIPFFKQYEAVALMGDNAFERVKNEYGENVKCKIECADCCHALFDLSLIEALYINFKFYESLSENKRMGLLEKANIIDRKLFKLKKNAYKEMDNGKSEEQIIAELSFERIRCPLLNEENVCDLYESRPITCRVYGIPTAIAGKGHTCGLSGFVTGKEYPSVNLDIIQNQLNIISKEFVNSIQSRYSKLGEILVPLSMALLTNYNDEYLGIGENKDSGEDGGSHG